MGRGKLDEENRQNSLRPALRCSNGCPTEKRGGVLLLRADGEDVFTDVENSLILSTDYPYHCLGSRRTGHFPCPSAIISRAGLDPFPGDAAIPRHQNSDLALAAETH